MLALLTLVPPERLAAGDLASRELAALVAFGLRFPDDDSLAAMGYQLRHLVASADEATLAPLISAGVLPAGAVAEVVEQGEAVVGLLPLPAAAVEGSGAEQEQWVRDLPAAVLSLPGILAATAEVRAARQAKSKLWMMRTNPSVKRQALPLVHMPNTALLPTIHCILHQPNPGVRRWGPLGCLAL